MLNGLVICELRRYGGEEGGRGRKEIMMNEELLGVVRGMGGAVKKKKRREESEKEEGRRGTEEVRGVAVMVVLVANCVGVCR